MGDHQIIGVSVLIIILVDHVLGDLIFTHPVGVTHGSRWVWIACGISGVIWVADAFEGHIEGAERGDDAGLSDRIKDAGGEDRQRLKGGEGPFS